MNIPEKLKENALNQLDQLLFILGTNSRVSLTTAPFIEQQSIASKILLSKLWELPDIQAEFCQSSQIDFDQFGKSNCIQAVRITKDGDTFLISGLKGKQITLTSYYHVGEVIAMHIGTWQQLSKDLDLIDTLLVVKRTEPVIQTSPIPTPESEGSSEGEARPNYIIRHFWENKRYAWQIIAISIVLTLLSVATPLGFQSTLIETLKGIKTIKSLANESFFRYRANTSLENNLYGRFKISKLSHIINAIVGFQSQMITVVVLFIGALAVFANEMTIGQLIAFNMLAGNVISPLVSLVMLASGYETFKLACRKLNELTPPQAPELQLKDNSIDLVGDIEFIDVWFKYPDSEDYALKGINLTIKQSEIIGVVGGSGSGKSTLAALLLGFYQPTKGKIRVMVMISI